jgi:hypothetical protein
MKHYLAGLLISVAFALLLTACSAGGGVRTKHGSASGPKDPGTPSFVDNADTITETVLPAGSTVESVPQSEASPAFTRVVLSAPTVIKTSVSTTKAQSGTVDTTVAQKRIEEETKSKEKAPLLYAGIACFALAIVAAVLKWPVVGAILAGGGAFFLASWKLAGLPDWFWMLGAACVLIGGSIFLGFKRSEWDANGNLIPDRFERKQ